MKWKVIKLNEICSVIDSLHKTPKYSETGFPMIRVTDVKCGYIDLSNTLKVEKTVYEEFSKKHKSEWNDIVMSRVGTIGTPSIVKTNEPFCLGQNTIFIVGHDNQVFLYYSLQSGYIQEQIKAKATGASQQTISLKSIRSLSVPNPPQPIQTRIASILSTYDDLIENNLKRIQLLEEAAMNIYREWFVHFRFPGHEQVDMVEDERGSKIPKGWDKVYMEEYCEIVGGGTPSTKNPKYWEGGDILWFSPTDLSSNQSLILLDSNRKITEEGLSNSSAKLLPPRSILMSSRATIGLFGMISKPCSTNQGFINLIPKQEWDRYFLLFNLMHRVPEIENHATGATFKEISKSKFKKFVISVPDQKVLIMFDKIVSPIIDQVEVLKYYNDYLNEARDILLPRLMNQTIVV